MVYHLDECKKEIITTLKKILSKSKYDCKVRLEIPPEDMGDFAFPCFSLAPIAKKSPQDIAKEIANSIKKINWIERIEPKGGYVNFYVDTTSLNASTLQSILKKKENYGLTTIH